jgi:hypothetical protein
LGRNPRISIIELGKKLLKALDCRSIQCRVEPSKRKVEAGIRVFVSEIVKARSAVLFLEYTPIDQNTPISTGIDRNTCDLKTIHYSWEHESTTAGSLRPQLRLAIAAVSMLLFTIVRCGVVK